MLETFLKGVFRRKSCGSRRELSEDDVFFLCRNFFFFLTKFFGECFWRVNVSEGIFPPSYQMSTHLSNGITNITYVCIYTVAYQVNKQGCIH